MIFATTSVKAEGDLEINPDPEPTEAPAEAKAKGPRKTEKGKYVIEKRKDGSTIKYEKKTKYDFEGADIEGLFKRPSGTYISNVQGVQTRSIIRIRKNFDAEIEDSARLLR